MSIHAIDLPANEDRSRIQQWFDTAQAMHEFLCGTVYAYANSNGSIRDHQGEQIGAWYSASFINVSI